MNIAVLYTKLTSYFMACMRNDVLKTGNIFHVYRHKPSNEAPFDLKSEKGIKIFSVDNKNTEVLLSDLKKFNPDIIFVSGWTNKKYLEIARYFSIKNIPTILGMDNQWKGNIRQHLAGVLSPIVIKPYFSHIWIPGAPQYRFAKKLGFKDENIFTGLYCADNNLFGKISQKKFNRKLLFVGRLVEHKGIKVLLNVLKLFINEKSLNFKVHFVGNGPLSKEIPKHELITHTNFVNPDKLPLLMKDAGFLILPSLYEAWGVVIHEAVIAGLPIITTHQTGAASEFVVNNENGFIYNAHKKLELKKSIINSFNLSENEYQKMSSRSKQLSNLNSLDKWSSTLNKIIEKG